MKNPDIPAGRTPITVRAWLTEKHLLVYVADYHVPSWWSFTLHCECCSATIARDERYAVWASIDEQQLEYRVCGYCDRQARTLLFQFVHRLRSEIFHADQDVFLKYLHEGDTLAKQVPQDDMYPDGGGGREHDE